MTKKRYKIRRDKNSKWLQKTQIDCNETEKNYKAMQNNYNVMQNGLRDIQNDHKETRKRYKSTTKTWKQTTKRPKITRTDVKIAWSSCSNVGCIVIHPRSHHPINKQDLHFMSLSKLSTSVWVWGYILLFWWQVQPSTSTPPLWSVLNGWWKTSPTGLTATSASTGTTRSASCSPSASRFHDGTASTGSCLRHWEPK